ncbi:MAG: hypothetical protein DRJ35_00615 [Thermoprotei archaeon]|nr:MAG: hypothetical protein DRJ35_00615 [Thermoprotei archaeon]
MSNIEKIWIKARAGDPVTINWGKKIVAFLEKKITQIYVDPILAYTVKKPVLPENSLDTIDLAIIIGGDGTLLRTIQRSRARLPPILGFTAESLGFFFDHRVEDYKKILTNILEGNYKLCNIALGEFRLHKEEGIFLNEVSIWAIPGKIIEFDLLVDGIHFYHGRSDGIILSTAAGSTGHALSYGSPIILNWEKPLIEIYPVGALSPMIRPLITFNNKIQVKLERWPSHLVVDGQRSYNLEVGCSIEISPSERKLKIVYVKNKCLPSTEKLRLRLSDKGFSFIP